MKKFVVHLTKDELMLLDGKCSYGVQRIVDRLKNIEKTVDKVIENIDYDKINKQAITHCVVCRESVKNKKINKNEKSILVRISGYYLGTFKDNNKPILVCDDCVNEYFKNIINNN